MAEEEKSETEEPVWLAELRESTTEERLYILRAIPTEELTVYYLRLISRILNLVGPVTQNVGGPNARTLEQFRDDIIAALKDRLDVERVTAQLEEAQIQAVEQATLGNWEDEALGIMGIEFETDEQTRAEGGINYLRRIIRSMDLRSVNHNVGGWDPRRGRALTLMDVKFDIDEELRNRMPHEPRGTPYYYNDDGELTNQPILADAEDSDVDGQAEQQWEQDTDEEEAGVVYPNPEDPDYDSDPEGEYMQNRPYHN